MNRLSPRFWAVLATSTSAIAGSLAYWYTRFRKTKKDVLDPLKINLTLQLINLTSQDIIYYSSDKTKIHTFKPYPLTWSLGLADKSKPKEIPYITANYGGGALKNGKIPVRHSKDWNYIIGLDDRLPGHRNEIQQADIIVTPDVADFLFLNSHKYENVCRHIFTLDPTLLVTTPLNSEIGIQGLVYRGTLQPLKAKYTSLDLYLHLTHASIK